MITAVTAFQQAYEPRNIRRAVVRDTLVMRFLILNRKPSLSIYNPFMIADLHKGNFWCAVNKNAVNTVIGFNIIENFISFGNEESIHFFISSYIKRAFKNTADMAAIHILFRLTVDSRSWECVDVMFLIILNYITQGCGRFFIQFISNPDWFSLFSRNENRTCFSIDCSSLRCETVINLTALIEASLSRSCAVCVSYTRSDCLSLKLSEIEKIVSHHTPFLRFRIKRFWKRIDGHTIAIKLIGNVKILSHVSAETVILLHDDTADKTVTGILHHLHKCWSVLNIFARFAIVTIYLIFAVAYEPYALLSLGGNGQWVITLILVAYGTANIDRRDTIIVRCWFFHYYRPPIYFAIVQSICGTFSIAHIGCYCKWFSEKSIIQMCALREYHRYGWSSPDGSCQGHSQGRWQSP